MNRCFQANPKSHIHILFAVVVLLSLLQFVPLATDLHVEETLVEAALRSVEVKITAGFCLGYISCLSFDIVLDVWLGNLELMVSRVVVLLAAGIYPIMILRFSDGDNIAATYACCRSFITLLCGGRVLIDIYERDSTQTWTLSLVYALLILEAIAFILFDIGLHFAPNEPSCGPNLDAIFETLIAIIIGTLSINFVWCIRVHLQRTRHLIGLRERLKRLSEDDVLVLCITGTLIGALISYMLIPLWSNGYSGFRHRNSMFINSDFIVTLSFAAALSHIPTGYVKHKAAQHRQDLAVKQSFVRYVSHEIRTPLNIVSVGLELIRGRLDASVLHKDKELLELLLDSSSSVEVAVGLVSDLLNYEKLESNLLVLETAECRLAPIVESTARPFRIQALKKKITLLLRFMDDDSRNDTAVIPQQDDTLFTDDMYVMVDENKVQQVLRNFMSNAIKFTPEGGSIELLLAPIYERKFLSESKRLSVLRSFRMASKVATLRPDYIRVVVKDSGHGMSLENQARVFKEVVQFHAGEQQGGGGSGFGLWLSKKIVDLHGGRVGVISEGEGCGSSFYFELPVSKVDADHSQRIPLEVVTSLRGGRGKPNLKDASSKESVRKPREVSDDILNRSTDEHIPVGSPLCFQSRHLLVVDDSAVNRKFTGRLVESLGHSFVEAGDGAECVELVRASLLSRAHIFHAVLIDNLMPRLPGPLAVEALREMGYNGLVVGLTGDVSEEVMGLFKRSGADEILCKPVHRADMVRLLSKMAA